MPHRIVQPSKEQVRAYMQARKRAHRPPPSPAEIRRQLGWRIETAPPNQISLVGFYRIPTEYSRVLLRLMFDWWVVRPSALYTSRTALKYNFKNTNSLK